MDRNCSINCDESVIVSFILAGDNVANMDVHIYQITCNDDEKESSLLASLQIRNNEIETNTFPKTASSAQLKCYNTGIECIRFVQKNPSTVLGNHKCN